MLDARIIEHFFKVCDKDIIKYVYIYNSFNYDYELLIIYIYNYVKIREIMLCIIIYIINYKWSYGISLPLLHMCVTQYESKCHKKIRQAPIRATLISFNVK